MQRSTDGTPAALLRRAPAWQYWQAIWYEPAWITWLKKIGCTGPCRLVATGSTFVGSYAGSASVRMLGDDLFDLQVRQEGREVRHQRREPDLLTPVRDGRLCRKWSGSALTMRPSVRFWGLIGRFCPAMPSPLPSAPWQLAQYWVEGGLAARDDPGVDPLAGPVPGGGLLAAGSPARGRWRTWRRRSGTRSGYRSARPRWPHYRRRRSEGCA